MKPTKKPTTAKLIEKRTAELALGRRHFMPLTINSWWVPGQALDEYPTEFMRDEAWRLEHIADKLSKGGLNNSGKVLRLAKRLGCTSKYVLRVMAAKPMMERVTELLRMKAVYGVAEAMPSQIQNSKSDSAAFKTLLQVGKVLQVGGGGAKVEINTTIDRRNGGDNESAVQFIERFRERSRQGLLRVNKAQAELVKPEEVDEPESHD